MGECQPQILLVDDNDLDAEKFLRACKRLDISNKVVCVRSGYEALDVLRGTNGAIRLQSPYVIMLDLNMPKMNGLEFLHELRSDGALRNTPVFMFSTSEQRKEIQAAYGYNVCGYIAKPLKMDDMLEAVRTLDSYWRLCELPLSDAQ